MDTGLLSILSPLIAFAIGIVIHESSHAFVADRLGDPTARSLGRVSLNPLHHIDLFGTVLLPLLLVLSHSPFVFGWAKPVPVNPYNFRNPLRDRLIVALAGPVSNLIAAVLFSGIAAYMPAGTYLPILMYQIAFINLVLMMFNLIPLPPLDGSAILPYIFRGQAQLLHMLETQGFMLLVGLILIDSVLNGVILRTFVWNPVTAIAHLLGIPMAF